MAELYVFGQILSATDFPDHSLFCKWSLHSGPSWKLIEGVSEGQTQADTPQSEECAHWSHPIDLHFLTKGLQGWPKLVFQVWNHDSYGRCNIWSYGCLHIPSQAGRHQLECHTWRPIGTVQDRISSAFTGESVKLTNEEVVLSGEDRFKLQTETMGKIQLDLYVVMKNFEKFGIEVK